MKRVSAVAAVCLALALAGGSCTPPGGVAPGEPPEAPKPGTELEAPAPREAPPRQELSLFLFLPQDRTAYAAGEVAEVTLVLSNSIAEPKAAVTLTLTDDRGATWKATDRLGTLPPGRHARTYGIATDRVPPGRYTLDATLGPTSFGSREITIAPAVPQTHYPIVGWVDKPPRHGRDARRWRRGLGLNTVLLQSRSPWRSAGANTIDDSYGEACAALVEGKAGRPFELERAVPPFTRVASLLTEAGLRWINACAVSGGGQRLLAPAHSFADPLVIAGGRQRIHHRAFAERRYANCAGVHFTSETTLGWRRAGSYKGPFGIPLQIEQFKRLAGLDDVPWREGRAQWDVWERYLAYRAGILGKTLASWADAVRQVAPGYVAASQLYEPTDLASGAYPPLQAAGLPVICTQAALDGPAGMLMPAIAADLQRAGNWDKRLWLMPLTADVADLDEVRAGLHLAIARKLDGVVYPTNLDYNFDRAPAPQSTTDLLASVSGINHTLTELGDFLLALEKPRDPVAIFYSFTEHAERIGRDPVGKPEAPDYPWTLLTAYQACMLAHFPPTFLTEEEVLAGEAAKSKAVLVIGVGRMRPEVKARLEAFVAGGGVVLTDPTTTVPVQGAARLNVDFPNLHQYHERIWRAGKTEEVDPTRELRDEVALNKLVYPILPTLRSELRKHVTRDYTVSERNVVVCHQRAGQARYVFVVNNKQRTHGTVSQQPVEVFRGLKWELQPTRTKLLMRRDKSVLYDVLGGAKVDCPLDDKGRPLVPLALPAGGMDILALLPARIGGVRITKARLADGRLRVAAFVHAVVPPPPDFIDSPCKFFSKRLWARERARPMDAALPIEVILRDPDGAEQLHLYRAHLPKEGYAETLPLPGAPQGGTWTLVVRDRLSGKSAEATVRVRAAAPPWIARQGALVAFDGDRIRALLRGPKPLWLIVGTEAEAKQAERLADALRSPDRAVDVKMAADVWKPRKLDSKTASRTISAAPLNAAMPDVRQPAILLGNIGSHRLLQIVHNYGILPRHVTPDYPGPGGALLCWLVSAFEPDAEVVVAAAADEAGVARALDALLRAARRTVPATARRSLACAVEPAPAAAEPPAVRLEPLWQHTDFDSPTCASTPLSGAPFFAVGMHDGRVVKFDVIGKRAWTHQCTTRARAVAVSPDGAFTATASFPELMLLTGTGRPHWGEPPVLKESTLRADFTAVAVAPSGAFVLAGTRTGQVLGVGMEGQAILSLGVPEGGAVPGAQPSLLGTINALALAPKLDFAVIGGERRTVAIDLRTEPPGAERWTSNTLEHVAALAISLDDQNSIAAGSRNGSVNCLSKDGAVRWSAPTDGYVLSVAFQGTSQNVLAASLDGTLTCYGEGGKILWRHRSPVGYRFVASSLDGETIAAAEFAGRAFLYDKSGKLLAHTPPFDGAIRALALSAQGDYLLLGTSAKQVALFKYERAKIAEDDEL